jgi:HK97 family phage major capsid protein
VFPDTETTGTSSATSSLWCGDWSRLYNVVRTDGIELQTLTERYAEMGQVGILAYYRGGSVATHPETFCRYKGILTTS